MASGGRNESNSHQLAGIGEKKIFHELDVHHVKKVGIKRFFAQEAEMSRFARIRRHELDESCLERRNQTFLASGGRNELARNRQEENF